MSTHPRSVILLSAEDDPADTVVPRLLATGADLTKIHLLSTVKLPDGRLSPFNLTRDIPVLEKALRNVGDVGLLVIDPVTAYMGDTDSHVNAEVRGLLSPLSDLAARFGVAVIAVTHVNKSSGAKALHRAMGSLAFIAAARAAHLVVGDHEDPDRHLLLPAKMNLAATPDGLAYRLCDQDIEGVGSVGRLEWEPGTVDLTADEALADEAGESDAKTQRDRAEDFLHEMLAGGRAQAKEVLRRAGEDRIGEKPLRAAFKRIGGKVHREGFGRGSVVFWLLPPPASIPLPPRPPPILSILPPSLKRESMPTMEKLMA